MNQDLERLRLEMIQDRAEKDRIAEMNLFYTDYKAAHPSMDGFGEAMYQFLLSKGWWF